ncbi:hypothetical protein B7P43_G10157 [Cryptotermes secundus]|uniref:C2H2-type domain-containing protein n=2 Tax=Cryptotermes secundus TaxID=105785 RepID=A0A2J7Q8K3_9NEOP|nr:zinc finger protein 672 [Cryptotermes secundus]PNF24920.1 hypothetical protein B7P43_G10157 [Cryptotermes secundus]
MSSVQKHMCVLCNNKLDSKEALQEHFRKHANKEIDSKGRPMKSRPGSAGKTSNKLSTPDPGRSKSGTGNDADTVCDVCGQAFDNVTVAIQHKFRKHPESAAKHFCPHCGMQFPLKINRDKHVAAEHSDDAPGELFPCGDCGVVFYTKEAEDYHSKSTHKRIVALFKPVATAPPSKKIKVNNAGEAQSVYYCHLCGYEYIVKFNLQKHLERQHTEEEQKEVPEDLIKCTTCDALFYNERAYDNHNMYHKPDDLYVTSEEQRLQTVSRVDQDFDIRRVQTAAEKFIPVYRPRGRPPQQPQKKRNRDRSSVPPKKREKEQDSTDELSPADSAPSSDSGDSDRDLPLFKRLDNSKQQHLGGL